MEDGLFVQMDGGLPNSLIATTHQNTVYAVKNPQEFKQLSEKIGVQVHDDLMKGELRISASRWGIRHLFAFRLLMQTEKNSLPILESEHDECPVCNRGESGSQNLHHEWTRILTSECSLDIREGTDPELLELPGGSFWVALAQAVRAENVEVKQYPTRERHAPSRAGYIDSTDLIIGSSQLSWSAASSKTAELSQSAELPKTSGQSQASGSVFQIYPDKFDEDEHEHDARRSKPENLMVQLLDSFLQQVLNRCLLQDTADSEVRLRVERRKRTAIVAQKFHFSAEDDGGICEISHASHGREMDYPSIALLDSKKAFKAMQIDDLTDALKPIVSNEILAQYLGEALAAWKSDEDLYSHESF